MTSGLFWHEFDADWLLGAGEFLEGVCARHGRHLFAVDLKKKQRLNINTAGCCCGGGARE